MRAPFPLPMHLLIYCFISVLFILFANTALPQQTSPVGIPSLKFKWAESSSKLISETSSNTVPIRRVVVSNAAREFDYGAEEFALIAHGGTNTYWSGFASDIYIIADGKISGITMDGSVLNINKGTNLTLDPKANLGLEEQIEASYKTLGGSFSSRIKIGLTAKMDPAFFLTHPAASTGENLQITSVQIKKSLLEINLRNARQAISGSVTIDLKSGKVIKCTPKNPDPDSEVL